MLPLRHPLPIGSLLIFFLLPLTLSLRSEVTLALTPEEELQAMRGTCEDRMFQMLQEERDVYRRVQYGSTPLRSAEPSFLPVRQAGAGQAGLTTGGGKESVLGVDGALTTDLVPYLTLNYHALSCRLRSVCAAVQLSHGHIGEGTVPPHRPVGCSRLFSARGRWWSEERRELGFNVETIPECAYGEVAETAPGSRVELSAFTVASQCTDWVTQILEEERQMLRLAVAQDSAHRGTRKVVSVLQSVLRDVRDSFLEPLRGVVDLFGSVIHPIPCLLTQCN